MDIGSKAGFYTHKSPKLHLFEVSGAGDGGRVIHPRSCTLKHSLVACAVACALLPACSAGRFLHTTLLPSPAPQWCNAQRPPLPKPRYSVRQVEGGRWGCKVVLPHPKRAEEDIVVFLPDAHAAADASEAEQRAAVAALERVAGTRNYHMLLPREYVGMWKDLGEVGF